MTRPGGKKKLKIGFFLLILRPFVGHAGEFSLGPTAGVMQQPNSSYFHSIFGGYAEWEFFEEKVILTGTYLERPIFRSQGYLDQESYGSVGVGTKVFQGKYGLLFCYAGWGNVRGVMKWHQKATLHQRTSRYLLEGPSVSAAGFFKVGSVNVGAEYGVFVGIKNENQLESFVAWAYSFLTLKIGMVV